MPAAAAGYWRRPDCLTSLSAPTNAPAAMMRSKWGLYLSPLEACRGKRRFNGSGYRGPEYSAVQARHHPCPVIERPHVRPGFRRRLSR
jgi:hypothetical protein